MFLPDQIVFHSLGQREYVDRLLQSTVTYYGDRLVSLAVFGSYARKTPLLNSDLDLYIVLKDLSYLGHSREQEAFIREIELPLEAHQRELEKSGILMEASCMILSVSGAEHFNPLYLDMVEDVVLVMDKDFFLKNLLSRTLKQMTNWGSIKTKVGGSWIWHISPKTPWGGKIDYE